MGAAGFLSFSWLLYNFKIENLFSPINAEKLLNNVSTVASLVACSRVQ
jgi:hypothetical protein